MTARKPPHKAADDTAGVEIGPPTRITEGAVPADAAARPVAPLSTAAYGSVAYGGR